jgi:hypothetical protein
MDREGVCFGCAFWLVKTRDTWTKDPSTVRTEKYQHYHIGDEKADGPKDWRGHAGHPFRITFNDGRVVETTNLWAQGEIPEHFRDRLPPNAKVESR